MDLYSLVTGLIGQNGRRGALMISIDCNHPDLEDFINVKSDLNKVTKANISIKITDEFMNAVKNREKYKLSFTREETGEVIEKEIDAYELLSEDKNFSYAGTNPLANLKRADLKPFLIDLDEDYNSTGRKFKYSVND